MDDLLERFLSGDSIQRQVISGGSTNGHIRIEREQKNYIEEPVPEQTTEYSEQFVEDLKKEVRERFENDAPPEKQDTTGIYEKYNFSHNLRAAPLPIESHKNEILETVRNNNVVVLLDQTGCGKTTIVEKVTQFILDDCQQNKSCCNIVVAQPRRIAGSSNAASLNAKRVCLERGWVCGSIVGYQDGSDNGEYCSNDTRILFCTTDVLLEKLIDSAERNPLDQYTHIILDEVHERDLDMNLLMITIYKYINPKIRVILMSATIDVVNRNKLATYYQISQDPQTAKAPVIELRAKRNFRTEEILYLDDLERVTNEERLDTPEISEQMYQMALKLIVLFERFDREHAMVKGVDIETYEKNPKPSVLVFLPGIYEIKQMHYRLDEWCSLNDETNIKRIVMHPTANPKNFEEAMMESNTNTRKIFLATNIAESSITLPDVKYVIDFCLSQTLVQMVWASRDNCEQRAGQTGRVTNGWCFRLVSRHFYNKKLKQSADAEVLTNPLENIILKIKQLDIGSPEEVLALAPDKPNLKDIHEAVLRLKEMGAMLATTKGQVKPRDGDITYIGEVMSRLPIDVKLSKFIALGYCFGVPDECISIAAALNCPKSFFLRDHVKGVQVYEKRLEFADGSGSDLFALLNAYKTWKRLRGQGVFGEANFLEITSLRKCFEIENELRIRLTRMNLFHSDRSIDSLNKEEKEIVLKVVIAGAFYPNYFSRSTVTNFKELGGRDPSNTVYFKSDDLPIDQNDVCSQSIKNILLENGVISERDFHNVTVSNDVGSSKVFVSFKKSGKEGDKKEYGVACQPGIVLTEVYKAVKLGKLKRERIDVLSNRRDALRYAQSRGDGNMHTIQVKGPYSPLKNTLYRLTNPPEEVKIDRNSVNHVLLENEPNDVSEKYLVAVSANKNDKHSSIIVRNTTLMPNIRGFGPLMAAISAPQIKLLPSEDETCYSRMITGLGCVKTNENTTVCLSSKTTMEFDLDVELKNSDIKTINEIRSGISCLLSREGQGYPVKEKGDIVKRLQNGLRSLSSTERLLRRNSKLYHPLSWGPYNQHDIHSNFLIERQHEKEQILPPHQYLRLHNSLPIVEVMNLESHHEELSRKINATNDDPTKRSERCEICNTDIDDGIPLHLMSRQHKDRMSAIKEQKKAI